GRSAQTRGGMKRDWSPTGGPMGRAPPAAPRPIRLMDSPPPPMVMSCCPDMISAAAKLPASSPEAQKRLIYLDARHAIAVARRECRHARDIAARLADRIDTIKDHVVEPGRAYCAPSTPPPPAAPG